MTYYTYYSYEEWGRGYIGYRRCPVRKTPETDEYLGSYRDKTFNPTAKEILGVYDTREEAMQAEIVLHEFFDVARNPHFANKACSTSTGFCLAKHSEETKKKISEARKGKFTGENHPLYRKSPSDETRRKMSEANKGKILSPETRKKMSEERKGKFTGENHSGYGKSLSDEHRRKISEALKSKFAGENNPMYGKTHSPETRRRMSEARKGKKSKLIDWYHPNHGEIFQISATDLVKLFPVQKLHQGTLCSVSLGRRSHHKGWRIVENVESPRA